MTTAAVDLELRKEFLRREGLRRRRVPALKDAPLTIERGDCVAILGQNGSGKSILVRGKLLCLDTVEAVRRRYGAATLEEAFFAGTGRSFEDEEEEDD